MGRLIDADMIEPHEQLEPLGNGNYEFALVVYMDDIDALPSVDAAPVVRCKDCKHNPKLEWFGCPMASLSEKQRPETAWCWKGERKDGERHD